MGGVGGLGGVGGSWPVGGPQGQVPSLEDIKRDLRQLTQLARRTDLEGRAEFRDLQKDVQAKIDQYLKGGPISPDERKLLETLPNSIAALAKDHQQIAELQETLSNPMISPADIERLIWQLHSLQNKVAIDNMTITREIASLK